MARKLIAQTTSDALMLHAHFDIDPESVDADEQLQEAIAKLIKTHKQNDAECATLRKDILRLQTYLDELEHSIIAVEQSRAWRVGLTGIMTIKKLLGRPIGRSGFTPIHYTLQRYHHWKKSRD